MGSHLANVLCKIMWNIKINLLWSMWTHAMPQRHRFYHTFYKLLELLMVDRNYGAWVDPLNESMICLNKYSYNLSATTSIACTRWTAFYIKCLLMTINSTTRSCSCAVNYNSVTIATRVILLHTASGSWQTVNKTRCPNHLSALEAPPSPPPSPH